jgi:hypothetical protein
VIHRLQSKRESRRAAGTLGLAAGAELPAVPAGREMMGGVPAGGPTPADPAGDGVAILQSTLFSYRDMALGTAKRSREDFV